MLDERKVKAIDFLIEGELPKSEIAKKVGIHRTTLYDWMDDEEFKAEWNRRLQQIKSFGEDYVKSKLVKNIENVAYLAQNAESEKVRLDAATYLVDRVLGKTTSKIDLTAEAKEATTVDDNVIDAEVDNWEEEAEQG